MEENFRAIFKLDYKILKELGVNKEGVRNGLKLRMLGLKNTFWEMLFERLDAITSRLCTETKRKFLEKISGQNAIAFNLNNARAIIIWAINNANKYYNEQLIKLYKDISTFDGVLNYKSNQRVWKNESWRYNREDHTHYALDYRIVVSRYQAIRTDSWAYDYTGNLSSQSHEIIEDVLTVFNNLGFSPYHELPSRQRNWVAGKWQNWHNADDEILFQAKAHMNGNVHFRFLPEAIKALNVEAGRLLGWLKNPEDVVKELGYSEQEANKYFKINKQMIPSNIKLLE